MGWLSDRLNSSIGKKFIMAVTGILLLLFLIIHLLNNLLLFLGPEIFNENVARLEAIKPLVRVIEVVLALIFIFHIYNAIKLYFENKKANPQKYAVDASSKNSTFYSRYMTVTGIIILIFLIMHLGTFWREYNFGTHNANDALPYYAIIQDAKRGVGGTNIKLPSILSVILNSTNQISHVQTFYYHKKYLMLPSPQTINTNL